MKRKSRKRYRTQERREAILDLIRKEPGISTPEIVDRLATLFSNQDNHRPDRALKRSVERDLKHLSDQDHAKIELEAVGGVHRYRPTGYMMSETGSSPMTPETALNFWLAGRHLEQLLPPAAMKAWRTEFEKAEAILQRNDQQSSRKRGMAGWRDKVRVLPTGPQRRVPPVDEMIRNAC